MHPGFGAPSANVTSSQNPKRPNDGGRLKRRCRPERKAWRHTLESKRRDHAEAFGTDLITPQVTINAPEVAPGSNTSNMMQSYGHDPYASSRLSLQNCPRLKTLAPKRHVKAEAFGKPGQPTSD